MTPSAHPCRICGRRFCQDILCRLTLMDHRLQELEQELERLREARDSEREDEA